MARAVARPRAKAIPVKKGGSLGLRFLGFLLMVLGMMMLPSTMLFCLGMAPTWVAYVIDLDRKKSAAVSVGALNLCGVIPFATALWRGGNSVEHATRILANVETWAVMYGAAAIGWIIFYAVPPVVAGVMAFHASLRLQDLESRRAALRAAWGDEVSGDPPAGRPH